MRADKQLFNFLCQLIDIQIGKYQALTKIGIGPDASMNAKLVSSQVIELLGLNQGLLYLIKSNPGDALDNKESVVNIFNQIRFYIEQEHLRGSAGLLLDENNIHFKEMERVTEQLATLKELAASAAIDITSPAQAVTPLQKQCEHDSYAIADYIITYAVLIKKNPDMEMDSKFMPAHAQTILRKHATGRYCDPAIAKAIDDMHKKCTRFLSQSLLVKSTAELTREDAIKLAAVHKEQLKDLMEQSKGFGSVVNKQTEHKPSVYSSRMCFFTGAVGLFSVLYYVCMQFMNQTSEESGMVNKH